MPSVQVYKSGTDPVLLEAEVNAVLAQHTNAVLVNWDITCEGTEIIFFGDIEIVAPGEGMGMRSLQFRCFGHNVFHSAYVQYIAWKNSATRVRVYDVRTITVGTYNVIGVLYAGGL